MMFKTTVTLTFLALVLLPVSAIRADTFGSGENEFDIEFVTIGNPGNADDTGGDPDPVGKVDSTYRIGKYEISEDMIAKVVAQTSLGITRDFRGPNKPATSIDWFEAVLFVNWLNTESGSPEAYSIRPRQHFDLWTPADAGYNPDNPYRNSLAKYFLPDHDEWYKAAYYDPAAEVYYDYPTGSDTAPTAVASGTAAGTAVYDQSLAAGPADITQAGGLSPYGTMGQGGNAFEWNETDFDLVNDDIGEFFGLPGNQSVRSMRGGDWSNGIFSLSPTFRFSLLAGITTNSLGFRVASVAEVATIPEPSTLLLGALASMGMLMRRRR